MYGNVFDEVSRLPTRMPVTYVDHVYTRKLYVVYVPLPPDADAVNVSV